MLGGTQHKFMASGPTQTGAYLRLFFAGPSLCQGWRVWLV